MTSARPPHVLLAALVTAVLGLLLNQAAGVAWLLVLLDVLPQLPAPPGSDGASFSGLNAASSLAGGIGGAATALALWVLIGWGLWRGQRWARAGGTILGAVAALYGLAPLVAVPLARRLLPDSVDLPSLGSTAVVLGVIAAALLLAAVALLWVPAARPWFHRDLAASVARP